MQDKVLGVRASPCELRMDTIQPIEASETQSSQDHILIIIFAFLQIISKFYIFRLYFKVVLGQDFSAFDHYWWIEQ